MAYQLEARNGGNQGENEKDTPEICGFFKQYNTHDGSTHGTNACPYRIGGTDGYGLYGPV